MLTSHLASDLRHLPLPSLKYGLKGCIVLGYYTLNGSSQLQRLDRGFGSMPLFLAPTRTLLVQPSRIATRGIDALAVPSDIKKVFRDTSEEFSMDDLC